MMKYVDSKNKPVALFVDDEDNEECSVEATQQPQQTQQTQQIYVQYRNKYKRENYIPTTHIDMAFSHHFPNSSIIYNINEDIKLCSIKISDLLQANVINWEFNRQPDQVRVPEIARHIYDSRKHINTHFYLGYNFKNDRFEIIDGSHRYWALKMLKSLSDANGEIIDDRLRNNNETVATWFNPQENIEWLLNSYSIVQINFKSSKNELILLRDDINHSQPMPTEMREFSQDIEKNGIINRIADEYINRYKQCFADSNNESYMRSNRKTNRDKFIVLLSKLYDKYNIDINRVGTLQQRLEIANDKIRCELQDNKIKCNQNIKSKCQETGCYLFLHRDETLFNLI